METHLWSSPPFDYITWIRWDRVFLMHCSPKLLIASLIRAPFRPDSGPRSLISSLLDSGCDLLFHRYLKSHFIRDSREHGRSLILLLQSALDSPITWLRMDSAYRLVFSDSKGSDVESGSIPLVKDNEQSFIAALRLWVSKSLSLLASLRHLKSIPTDSIFDSIWKPRSSSHQGTLTPPIGVGWIQNTTTTSQLTPWW